MKKPEGKYSAHLTLLKPYQRPKLSDPAHETRGLQPGRDGRVRCSAWLGGTDCECKTWCSDGPPLTEHHRNCPKRNLEAESVALVSALIKGIENWAADEDGVHPDAWDAYCHAIVFVGDLAKLKVVLEKSESVVPPNDPSSATADAGRELKPRREPPFAEARG